MAAQSTRNPCFPAGGPHSSTVWWILSKVFLSDETSEFEMPICNTADGCGDEDTSLGLVNSHHPPRRRSWPENEELLQAQHSQLYLICPCKWKLTPQAPVSPVVPLWTPQHSESSSTLASRCSKISTFSWVTVWSEIWLCPRQTCRSSETGLQHKSQALRQGSRSLMEKPAAEAPRIKVIIKAKLILWVIRLPPGAHC